MNKIFAYVVLHIIQSETMCSSKTQNKKNWDFMSLTKQSVCSWSSIAYIYSIKIVLLNIYTDFSSSFLCQQS